MLERNVLGRCCLFLVTLSEIEKVRTVFFCSVEQLFLMCSSFSSPLNSFFNYFSKESVNCLSVYVNKVVDSLCVKKKRCF